MPTQSGPLSRTVAHFEHNGPALDFFTTIDEGQAGPSFYFQTLVENDPAWNNLLFSQEVGPAGGSTYNRTATNTLTFSQETDTNYKFENPIQTLGFSQDPARQVEYNRTLIDTITFTQLTDNNYKFGAADLVAQAFAGLSAFSKITGGGDAVANAFTTMNGKATLRFTGDTEANAFANLAPTIRQRFSGDAEANAFTSMRASLYVNAVNPLTGGLDYTDPNIFGLTVNSTIVSLTDTRSCLYGFNINDLSIGYAGKELSFSEYTRIGSPTFAPEQTVALDVDFGTGIQRVFTGRIKSRDHEGRTSDEEISYNAVDYFILGNDITCINTDGRPRVEFTIGTTITSVTSNLTNVQTTFSKTVAEALADVFSFNATQLQSYGIPSTIGAPGLESFDAVLPETVNLENTSFTQAIEQLAGYQDGTKVFFDESQGAWTFPNFLNMTTVICDVASMNVEELPITFDTSDRYTAIRLYGDLDDFLDDPILTNAATVDLGGNTGTIQRTTVDLTPKWLTELEGEWTIAKAMAGAAGTLEDENFFVFRRWSMPNSVIPQWPNTPVRVYQKVNFWGQVGWRPLHGRSYFGRKEFIARFHAISQGNPHVPGDAFGPDEVKLSYYPLQFDFTYPTSTTSEGTPTSFVNTQVDISEFPETLRIPATGFQGTAFTEFGIERELIQLVDRTEVTSANAQALLDARKDIIVSGTVPIGGAPVQQFINLGVKAVVRHPTIVTKIETYPAFVTQYNYTFGARGQNSIELTTDIGGLIGP